jgi:hypothetical protein
MKSISLSASKEETKSKTCTCGGWLGSIFALLVIILAVQAVPLLKDLDDSHQQAAFAREEAKPWLGIVLEEQPSVTERFRIVDLGYQTKDKELPPNQQHYSLDDPMSLYMLVGDAAPYKLHLSVGVKFTDLALIRPAIERAIGKLNLRAARNRSWHLRSQELDIAVKDEIEDEFTAALLPETVTIEKQIPSTAQKHPALSTRWLAAAIRKRLATANYLGMQVVEMKRESTLEYWGTFSVPPVEQSIAPASTNLQFAMVWVPKWSQFELADQTQPLPADAIKISVQSSDVGGRFMTTAFSYNGRFDVSGSFTLDSNADSALLLPAFQQVVEDINRDLKRGMEIDVAIANARQYYLPAAMRDLAGTDVVEQGYLPALQPFVTEDWKLTNPDAIVNKFSELLTNRRVGPFLIRNADGPLKVPIQTIRLNNPVI